MTIDYSMEYVKEHIKEDIDNIKRQHCVDVSPEIGRVIKSFVSYYENRDVKEIELYRKFLDAAKGLEKFVKRKLENPVSLHETMKAGVHICRAIRGDNKLRLREINNYYNKLIHKELELNGHLQLPL